MKPILWKSLKEGDRFQFMPGMKTYTVKQRQLARARGYIILTLQEPLPEGSNWTSRYGDDQVWILEEK